MLPWAHHVAVRAEWLLGGRKPPKVTPIGGGGGGGGGDGKGSDGGNGAFYCPGCRTLLAPAGAALPSYLWCKNCHVVFGLQHASSEYAEVQKGLGQQQGQRQTSAAADISFKGITPKEVRAVGGCRDGYRGRKGACGWAPVCA